MNILIIDDEAGARENITGIIDLSFKEKYKIKEAANVADGVKAIEEQHPDIVLLDINMPDGTGFDLLKQLKFTEFKLIFVTAYEEYALKAFDFSAIDYILKPIDPEKLAQAVLKASEMVESENLNLKLKALFTNLSEQSDLHKKLVLKTSDNIFIIDTKEIVRCESDESYTRFFLADNRHILVSKNLIEYESILRDFGFFRTHRSHLINLAYIDNFTKREGGFVVMKDKAEIPISRRKKEEFLNLLEML
ncbi:MAG: response regulator transcription factor [Chlorobi bacterium]|nr:response regulator transcription factor [Chlorobiota bacterium]